MKKKITISIVIAVLLSVISLELSAKTAYQFWTMVVMEDNSDSPDIIGYYSELETAENGNKYYHIYNEGSLLHHGIYYNPIQLPSI